MQLIMGIGTAEELALAEIKAEEAMKRTLVEGSDADEVPAVRVVTAKCPYTGHVQEREWTEKDPVVWTGEAFDRLRLVPLIARPLARNTVERFAREHAMWRITTRVMDENKQAMIEADEFDVDTMLVMFKELQTKQLQGRRRGRGRPDARDAALHRRGEGGRRHPLPDPRHREADGQVSGRLQDGHAGGGQGRRRGAPGRSREAPEDAPEA